VLSAPFVAFFNHAARTSEASTRAAREPARDLSVRRRRPSAPIALTQGGQEARFGKNAPPMQFAGRRRPAARRSSSSRSASSSSSARRARRARAAGEWALFRMTAQAPKWEQVNPTTWKAEWNAGGPVALEFTFPNGLPALQRGVARRNGLRSAGDQSSRRLRRRQSHHRTARRQAGRSNGGRRAMRGGPRSVQRRLGRAASPEPGREGRATVRAGLAGPEDQPPVDVLLSVKVQVDRAAGWR
jgi:hypothetical protein